MSVTQNLTRVIATVAGIAVAVAFVASVATPAKAALSQSQVSAIISLLQSFGADATTIANVQASLTGGTPSAPTTGGSGAACYAWTRSLTVGSTGADVQALQVFLNSNASTMVAASGAGSPGMESTYFGPATKAAVAKFQTANGITPAAGYFGPVTRAAVAAACAPSTGGTGGTGSTGGSANLQGGEGSLDINGDLGDVETDVDEGKNNVAVLGAELEGNDSDIGLQRVDVDITLSGTGSTRLTNYFDTISLWLDDKKLAEMDAGDVDKDTGDVYSFRFTNLASNRIQEDETSNLYVKVDAVGNIDSGDTAKVIVFNIPENGIRAVDGAGISDTYVSSSESTTLTSANVNVVEATTGDLEITEGDNNPEGKVVTVDEDDDTNGVLVLAFDVEANNQDVVIDAIPVGFVTSENEGVDGPVKRAILKRNGTTIDTVSIPTSAGTSYQALFNNLNINLNDGDTDEFEVYVDLNDADVTTFATGSTMYATTTGSDGNWDVEDNSGDSVTPSGSVDNSGELLVFQTEGISVKLVSVDESKTFTADASGEADVGEFKIVVDITAVGGDMWVDKDATSDPDRGGTGSAGTGFQWATTTQSTTGTTTVASVLTASGSTGSDSATGFKISEGQTRRFTLTVSLTIQGGGSDGVTALQLTGINYDTDSTVSDSTTFYTSNLSDFKTDLLTMLIQ